MFVLLTQAEANSGLRCQERRRLARPRQHKTKLWEEEERLHDIAADNGSLLPATLSPAVSPLRLRTVASSAAVDRRRDSGRHLAAASYQRR